MSRQYNTAFKSIIPTTLRLPDGREIPTRTLKNKITNRTNINLLKKQVKAIPDKKSTAASKYTIEERIWQSQATPEEIAERYGYTIKRATGIKYSSRYIVDKLEL